MFCIFLQVMCLGLWCLNVLYVSTGNVFGSLAFKCFVLQVMCLGLWCLNVLYISTGNVFGSLEFNRRDLMAVNIQRARDHGVADFNTVRRAYGLDDRDWDDIITHTDIPETVIIIILARINGYCGTTGIYIK